MSLTEIAKQTQKTINLAVLFIILLVIFRISLNLGIYLWNKYHPPEITGPDHCYQALSRINIDSYPLAENSKPSYVLDNVTGVLPTLPDRAPVYELPEKPTLISIEKNAEDLAKSFGFKGAWVEESDVNWIWQDRTLGKSLKMNLILSTFTLETDLRKLAQAAPLGTAPTKIQAVSKAKEFLNQHDLLPPNFEAAEDVKFLKIGGDYFLLAPNESKAQVVEVNFSYSITPVPSDFPGFEIKNLPREVFPVKGENPEKGLIQVYVTGSTNPDYIIPKVYYFAEGVNENRRCTYSIKSSSEAWEELVNGKASIVLLRAFETDPYASYTPLDINQIMVRQIYLAYLDLATPQKYLQPIYVFEGEAKTRDNKRAVYVSYLQALKDDWVK